MNILDRIAVMYNSIPEKGAVFISLFVPFVWILLLLAYQYYSAKIKIWEKGQLRELKKKPLAGYFSKGKLT
jgi:hypothetical protein